MGFTDPEQILLYSDCALKCCLDAGVSRSAVDNTWKNSLQTSG